MGMKRMLKKTYRRTIAGLFVMILLFALTACNLTGGNGGATVDNNANASATAIFQTLDAQSIEMTSQPQAPAATEQPPAETQASVQTEPPAAVQPGQPTAAGGAVTAIASINTNCRSGPDKKYPKVSNLGASLRSTIQGKDASGSWFYIQNNKKAGGFCWVSAATVKTEGDIGSLPIVEAMSLEAAQTQAAQTVIPQAPVAPVNQTPNPTPSP
jgi:hypothetical protein